MQQMSTALSDLILAITSFGTALSILRQNTVAAMGFLLMGVAASCGTYRFSRASPSAQVLYWHQTLAWLTTVLGMSLVAAGFHRCYNNSIMSSVHMGFALGLVCISKGTSILNTMTEARLVSGISAAAVVSIGIFSVLNTNPFGLLGAVVYCIAGAVGTTGDLVNIPCVDWFHYLLAFANVVFLRAFTYSNPGVFYKDS